MEISLNSCCIGNLGLRAICVYLHGNERLKALFVQNVSKRSFGDGDGDGDGA